MPKAVWKDTVIAESGDTIVVENNHYFPPDTVNKEFLKPSDTSSFCPWKGKASYYHIEVDGEVNRDAAWTYPNPKEKAQHIKDYVAFWRGVEVVE